MDDQDFISEDETDDQDFISQEEHALRLERKGTVDCIQENLKNISEKFSAAEERLKSHGAELYAFAEKHDFKGYTPDSLEYFLTLIGEKIESNTYEDDLHLWFLKMQQSTAVFYLVKNSIERAERAFFPHREYDEAFSGDIDMAISCTTKASYWLGIFQYSLLFLGQTLHSEHAKRIGGKKDDLKRKLTVGYMRERLASQRWELREQFFYAMEDEIPEKLEFKRSIKTIERYFYAYFSDAEKASFDRKSRKSKKL